MGVSCCFLREKVLDFTEKMFVHQFFCWRDDFVFRSRDTTCQEGIGILRISHRST